MKIWLKFHIFAPKIVHNPENALAMKIRLELSYTCTLRTGKHLKSGKIQKIPLPMKIWHKFHMFAPKIRQNPENALAMKIRLEFRILAPHWSANILLEFSKFWQNLTDL